MKIMKWYDQKEKKLYKYILCLIGLCKRFIDIEHIYILKYSEKWGFKEIWSFENQIQVLFFSLISKYWDYYYLDK